MEFGPKEIGKKQANKVKMFLEKDDIETAIRQTEELLNNLKDAKDIKRNENLPFNDWSQEKIEKGKKKCTSRTKKYVDDERVDYIVKMPLKYIKKYLYSIEGADSPEELQKVFNKIFRKKVDEERKFYVHFGEFEGDNN